MPTRRKRVPSYRLHRPSGQARVIINGEHIYLGKYGSAESEEKYNRLVADWLRSNGTAISIASQPSPRINLTINELLAAYWGFAQGYYVKNGQPTGELGCIKAALRPVRRLYGSDLHPVSWSMRNARFLAILHFEKEVLDHEKEALYGSTDCLRPSVGRVGHAGCGDHSKARRFGADVLPLGKEVRRHEL